MKPSHSLSRHASGVLYLWYVDENGKRRKVSTGSKQKADAKTWVMKFLGGQVQARSKRKNLSIKEFSAEYLNHSRQQHKLKTYKNCQTCFNVFIRCIGDRRIRDIKVKDIQDFMDEKQSKTSAATARRIYTAMASAFESARKWGYVETNVWRSIKKPKLVERTPNWLTVNEFAKLMDTMAAESQRDSIRLNVDKSLKQHERDAVVNRKTMHRLIITAFNTGLRSGELRNLRANAVDLERRVLKVRNTLKDENNSGFTTKSSRERIVPLNDTAYEVLKVRAKNVRDKNSLMFPQLRNGQLKVMDESYLGRCFKRWVRKAGLNPQLRFHDLRHSFASNLATNGVPLFSVGKMMGHSDTKTTEIYAHLAPSNLWGILDTLNHPQIAAMITGPAQTRANAKLPKKGKKGRPSIAKLTVLVEELLQMERSRTSA